jgi:hypothetical protein
LLHLALCTRDGRIQSWAARQKRTEKKTLVLSLGSLPEKGGKKKQKKTLVLILGSLPQKGKKKKPWY